MKIEISGKIILMKIEISGKIILMKIEISGKIIYLVSEEYSAVKKQINNAKCFTLQVP